MYRRVVCHAALCLCCLFGFRWDRFRRSSAGDAIDPATVRTPEALLRTMEYLNRQILDQT